jgi:hypothetical protein
MITDIIIMAVLALVVVYFIGNPPGDGGGPTAG